MFSLNFNSLQEKFSLTSKYLGVKTVFRKATGHIDYVSGKSLTSHRIHHVRIQKVLAERVQLSQVFFLVDEVGENPNATIIGPSSTRQRNAI